MSGFRRSVCAGAVSPSRVACGLATLRERASWLAAAPEHAADAADAAEAARCCWSARRRKSTNAPRFSTILSSTLTRFSPKSHQPSPPSACVLAALRERAQRLAAAPEHATDAADAARCRWSARIRKSTNARKGTQPRGPFLSASRFFRSPLCASLLRFVSVLGGLLLL